MCSVTRDQSVAGSTLSQRFALYFALIKRDQFDAPAAAGPPIMWCMMLPIRLARKRVSKRYLCRKARATYSHARASWTCLVRVRVRVRLGLGSGSGLR